VTEARIVALRREQRLGPARIAGVLTLNPSTVHRVLVRRGMPRLAFLDRPTGEPIRRYERAHPGEPVYVDVEKLGVIRPGGGWRVHGRDSLERRQARYGGRAGYHYVHCAIDDHTRLAYAESCRMRMRGYRTPHDTREVIVISVADGSLTELAWAGKLELLLARARRITRLPNSDWFAAVVPGPVAAAMRAAASLDHGYLLDGGPATDADTTEMLDLALRLMIDGGLSEASGAVTAARGILSPTA
jgi:hypothetical protein